MADLALQFGGDLSVSATGDLLVVSGAGLTEQRVLRRLLTNAGDYIWQLTYGAGLGAYVGQPAVQSALQGVIRNQLALESAVAQTPAPVITAMVRNSGNVDLSITYSDAQAATSTQLNFLVA